MVSWPRLCTPNAGGSGNWTPHAAGKHPACHSKDGRPRGITHISVLLDMLLLFFFLFAKYIFYHSKKTCVSQTCIEIFRLVIQAQFSLKTKHDLRSVSQGSLTLFHTLEIHILRNFIFLPFP